MEFSSRCAAWGMTKGFIVRLSGSQELVGQADTLDARKPACSLQPVSANIDAEHIFASRRNRPRKPLLLHNAGNCDLGRVRQAWIRLPLPSNA